VTRLHGVGYPVAYITAAVTWALAGLAGDGAAQAPVQRPTSADSRLLEAIDWYTGVAGRVDDRRARALLLEVLDQDPGPLTEMWLARVYSTGRMGFAADPERARKIAGEVLPGVRTLAASGDVEALFLMGTAYDEGLGVTANYREGLRWYLRAAARGHVLATHNVGNVYRDGRGVAVDDGAAARWWLRAARAGDAIPQLRLGQAFEAGRGVTRDLDTARYWYGRAAAAGNAAATEALERISR
jgi:TPR repeat protein